MKKIAIAVAACGICCATLFSQAQNENDSSIPLGEDLSGGNAVATAATAGQAAPASATGLSALSQGLWIETTVDSKFLTRDLATGEKKGYEFDKADLISKGNWWFYGNLNPSVQLDTEIGVWKFDNVMYKSNSYGANVPDVTWGDGFQSMGSRAFSPASGANDTTVGGLNKLGFTVTTPLLQARTGYGNLGEHTMSNWSGIYSMLDSWKDVGKGFEEFSNGSSLREFGPVKVNALFALSRMRAEYGMYSVLDAKVADKGSVALTWGSTSNSSELFRYDEQNSNAVSAYASVNPLSSLKFELHGLGSYGTGKTLARDTSAGAARVTWTSDKYTVHAAQSLAGSGVATVWGRDNTVGVDGALSRVGQWYTLDDSVGFGLDTDFMMNDIKDLPNGLWNLRNEPMLDLNLNRFIARDMTTKFYGVVDVDRIAIADSSSPAWAPYFEEAGVEVQAADLAANLKKVVFAYAAYATHKDWTSTAGYAVDVLYHSIALTADVTDSLSSTFATVIRTSEDASANFVPAGFAAGVSLKTNWVKIGAPKLWVHATYDMDPYEDNNYSLYRYDNPDNKLIHRSYRLNILYGSVAESHIRFGMIWDLK